MLPRGSRRCFLCFADASVIINIRRMQVAGSRCQICEQRIVLAAEATWCGRCCHPFHSECLKRQEYVCPECHQEWIDPFTQFTYSARCPSCGTSNSTPPEQHCQKCGADLHWDTKADYDRTRLQVNRRGWVTVVQGFLEFAGAAMLVLTSVGLIGPFSLHEYGFLALIWPFVVLLFVAGSIILSVSGIRLVSRGLSMIRFI
jgi:hypothetical protein